MATAINRLKTPTAIIALVAGLLYANTLGNELVLDDDVLIRAHRALQGSPWNLSEIFGGRYWANLRTQDTLYRPLTIWTLTLNAGLNRTLGLPFDHPAGYRLINLLLHAGVSVCCYRFARLLGLSMSTCFLAALLFAVHPIHTEAVASIVNRSELLAAGFGLFFLILHLRQQTLPALLCLLLALFSKESAVSWIPLAIWMDVTFQSISPSRYGYYGGILVFWFACRNLAIAGVLQAIPPLDNPLATATIPERLFTAARVQLDYIWLQIFPLHLSSDYSWNQIPIVKSPFHPSLIGLILLTLSAIFLGWKTRRLFPHIPFALGSYALMFALTSNFLFPIGTLMGERLVYAPSLFFCLLAGLGAQHLLQKWSRWGLSVVLLILLTGSTRTLLRNQVWSTPDRFYRAQVQSAPNSARAHYALARSLYPGTGDPAEALAHYRRAVEILPNFPDAWNNLGVVYKDSGDLQSAIEAFQKAISFHDKHREVYYNLGLVYQQKGELENARKAYETARRLNPEHPPTCNNLAAIYIGLGKPDTARALLKEALRLNPDYEVARKNLKRLTETEK